ncbi:cyclopropane fatty acyl phospholipid synthase [Tupanvirus deep ocean]|uniref:Cyclopropane fatty acyl phospholipid synthase n=2 Tax=Tupanvirus TaxID=2094720 RepID=A0AC62A8E3_9VIRU|nr:cyclopropane fatty acyl phospholipid synthase [Tupanvirus deep ocean]QKU34045.1 cyclopropane fatty acyl phospholipid synthase [Tupanvirus deep ocean]
MSFSREIINKLAQISGIEIGIDIIVNDERFYDRVFKDDSLGFGESYVLGWWDAGAMELDEIFYRISKANIKNKLYDLSFYSKAKLVSLKLYNYWFPVNSIEESKVVAVQHYNLGNELYEMMLEPMIYSCAYFRSPSDSLYQAQINKMELISKKLKIESGTRVLDIGCGWGELAFYLSENNVFVDGITISEEQFQYAQQKFSSDYVKFHLVDYREFAPSYQYDAIVSVGMFEHVNSNNYKEFMEIVHKLLKPGGLFLLHTIGSNISTNICDRWINKYIFPNSALPSIAQIASSSEGKFVIEDVHNIGPHYDKTLMCWYNNFTKNFDKINSKRETPFSNEFFRMWSYYLLACAGSFRARNIQLYQVVLSKESDDAYQRPNF